MSQLARPHGILAEARSIPRQAPGLSSVLRPSSPNIYPTFGSQFITLRRRPNYGLFFVGPNTNRGAGIAEREMEQGTEIGFSNAGLDVHNASENDRDEFIDVGNPANPRVRREWERKEGQTWPRDPVTGRNHDVAHVRAKADGGADTVDNIRPLHPDAHRAEHVENGDYSRWGKRSGIARAFGGVVGSVLGPFSILSDITGILSGRIRTDSMENFAYDMMGQPSPEDRRKAYELYQRSLNPKWKPGDPDEA